MTLARLTNHINYFIKAMFYFCHQIKQADLLLMQNFIKEWRVHGKPEEKGYIYIAKMTIK